MYEISNPISMFSISFNLTKYKILFHGYQRNEHANLTVPYSKAPRKLQILINLHMYKLSFNQLHDYYGNETRT